MTPNDFVAIVSYGDCPIQHNTFDCGIICVGVCLHLLLEGIPINSHIFHHRHVTKLRKALLASFDILNEQEQANAPSVADVIRNCFPFLNGNAPGVSNLLNLEVEVPGMKTGAEKKGYKIEMKRKTSLTVQKKENENKKSNDDNEVEVVVVAHNDDDNDKNDNDDAEDADAEAGMEGNDKEDDDEEYIPPEDVNNDDDDTDTNADSVKGNGKREEGSTKPSGGVSSQAGTTSSSTAQSSILTTEDNLLHDILAENNSALSFSNLEDFHLRVEMYEEQSGNAMRIGRSLKNQFRHYECSEHIGCGFFVLVALTRSGVKNFTVTRSCHFHSGERPKARAGRPGKERLWKKRRIGTLTEAISLVLRTKEGKPCPADVQKTAMDLTKKFVPYMSCYCALNLEQSLNSSLNAESFQMIGPYLNGFAIENPRSVVGFDRDSETNAIKSLHVYSEFHE